MSESPTHHDPRSELLEIARKAGRIELLDLPPVDAEMAAMAACFEALTPLSPTTRLRVLAYLRARSDDPASWPVPAKETP